MFFSSVKGVNRFISKGMSNIYLKVTIERKLHSKNFDFLSSDVQLTQILLNF